jgi:hypothetical protein
MSLPSVLSIIAIFTSGMAVGVGVGVRMRAR